MRPLKLTMSAFGPYAGKEVVALDELGEAGIYLITGETGAGKTTIFDGICYALYGMASGTDRESRMFRSKYAAVETPTYVELEFSYKGKIYVVKRNPEYQRPKNRGEGMMLEKPQATLSLPNGEILAKVNEVNGKIEEILGVNYNQFTKIVMIAQGAFKEFLFAGTDERSKIFRQIFGTGNYELLQENLAKALSEVQKKRHEARHSVQQYFADVTLGEESTCSSCEDLFRNEEANLQEALTMLHNIVQEDEEIDRELSEELEKQEETLSNLRELLGRAQQIAQTKQHLAENEQKLPELLRKKEEAEREAEKLPEYKKQETLLQEQIAKGKQELQIFDQIDEKEKKMKDTLEEYQLIDQKMQMSKEEEIRTKGQLEENIKEQKAMEVVPEKYAGWKEALGNIAYQKNRISEWKQRKETCDQTEQQCKAKQERYLEAQGVYDVAKSEYERKKQLFYRAQAGILAETLEEGMPCPVCGSTEHPKLAIRSVDAPNQEELEQLAEVVEKEQTRVSKESEAAGALVAKKQEQLEQLKKSAQEILEESTGNLNEKHIENHIENLIEAMEHKLLDLEQQEEVLRKEISEYENKVARLKELTQIQEQLNEKRKNLTEQQMELTARHGQLKGSVDEAEAGRKLLVEKTLTFSSREETKLSLRESQGKLETIAEQMEIISTSLEKARNEYQSTMTSIENYKLLLKNASEIDVDECQQQVEEREEQKRRMTQKRDGARVRLFSNQNAYINIKKRQKELLYYDHQYQMIKGLSDTANAKLTGKQRIDLETYVQMAYFDRIIVRANVRLLTMTAGQYELKRREEKENFRSKVGLDLDVIDHYNGSVRSVKSLSGGEAFKASLALALGVSDEIQQNTSGIQFDSMFIDEGFGSLDEESLRQAIEVLMKLSDGKRLVGIISHVGELKERVERQIQVTKDRDGGSHILIR